LNELITANELELTVNGHWYIRGVYIDRSELSIHRQLKHLARPLGAGRGCGRWCSRTL